MLLSAQSTRIYRLLYLVSFSKSTSRRVSFAVVAEVRLMSRSISNKPKVSDTIVER